MRTKKEHFENSLPLKIFKKMGTLCLKKIFLVIIKECRVENKSKTR